ncbi:hypothetical protein [Janibacter melonis]|uniref:hypothetical protein n=1 Tax=Janibacter melonis TaxID=262209 RepID=UPI002095C677|nr:hypothetical protein [Janibacter melonis]
MSSMSATRVSPVYFMKPSPGFTARLARTSVRVAPTPLRHPSARLRTAWSIASASCTDGSYVSVPMSTSPRSASSSDIVSTSRSARFPGTFITVSPALVPRAMTAPG